MEEIEKHPVDTNDGYRLVLQRLNGGDKGPVIMCHGLSGNSYEYLISEDERHSLARYLANKGFDSWVVDLRGHGNSKGYFLEEKKEWDYSQKSKGYWNFYIDDLMQQDTPAIINKVKEVSNSGKVSWIGRSMGGWLSYAHAIDGYGKRDFKGVISVASPSHFSPNITKIMGSSPYMKGLLDSTPFDHLSMGSFSPKQGKSRSKLLKMMSDESRLVLLDFLDYVKRGEVAKHDYGKEGNVDQYGFETSPSYWEKFGKIDVPIVFITGTRDIFASPEITTESYNRVKKTNENVGLHILPGFGHINILVGKNAYEGVYPIILDSLNSFE